MNISSSRRLSFLTRRHFISFSWQQQQTHRMSTKSPHQIKPAERVSHFSRDGKQRALCVSCGSDSLQRDSVVHFHPSCFGDKGHQSGPGLHEVGIRHNQDLCATLTYPQLCPSCHCAKCSQRGTWRGRSQSIQVRSTPSPPDTRRQRQCLMPVYIAIPAAALDWETPWQPPTANSSTASWIPRPRFWSLQAQTKVRYEHRGCRRYRTLTMDDDRHVCYVCWIPGCWRRGDLYGALLWPVHCELCGLCV